MFSLPKTVLAHCDIPCKVYDPAVAQLAALSVVRLIDLIVEIENPYSLTGAAQLSRLVTEKETQSKVVKSEVSTIWGDYFKEPQIVAYPGVHALVHDLMQTASA
jgi:nickel superoxide dismutase